MIIGEISGQYLKKIFLIIVLVLFPGIGYSASYTVTSCTTANVQAAHDSASAGDKIYLNCSGATWSSYVNVTKGIEIYGNGQDSTVLTANNSCLFNVSLASGNVRLHDLGMTGSGGSCGGLETQYIRASGNGSTIWNSFRADHLKFTNTNSHSVTFDPWWNIPSHPKALFDHITWSSNITGSRLLKLAGNNSTWRSTDQYGTDWGVFIEDSSFSWTGGATGAVTDTEHGARLIVRHNTITNGTVQMHDTGSTQAARGNRIMEIYENTFSCTAGGCSNMPAMGLRGGGYIVYNNTISGGYFSAAWPQIWRTDVGAGFLGGMCNGSAVRACNTSTYYHCSAGDHAVCSYSGDNACTGKGSCVVACTSNSDCPTGTDGTATCLATVDKVDGGSNPYGWPCRDQTGRGMEYGLGGALQESSPVYWYNNKDGSGKTITFGNGYPNYFQLNRDYCTHDPSTSCGTKSGWTYASYTYPHPLTGGNVPNSPKPNAPILHP